MDNLNPFGELSKMVGESIRLVLDPMVLSKQNNGRTAAASERPGVPMASLEVMGEALVAMGIYDEPTEPEAHSQRKLGTPKDESLIVDGGGKADRVDAKTKWAMREAQKAADEGNEEKLAEIRARIDAVTEHDVRLDSRADVMSGENK